MKKFTVLTIFVLTMSFINTGIAGGTDDKESTKLNLWVPGFVIKIAGSIIAKNADGKGEDFSDLSKHIGDINICIRDGSAYTEGTDSKIDRKLNRLDKRNYEQLINVNGDDTQVNVSIRERKNGNIKRIALIVDEPGQTFVYMKMHCNIKAADINKVVSMATNNSK